MPIAVVPATNANAKKENILSSSVSEIFDNTKAYEEACENLRAAPIGPSPTALDVEIEEKLSKLKLLNEACFNDGTTDYEVLGGCK